MATMSLVVDFLESRGLHQASSMLKSIDQGQDISQDKKSALEEILSQACSASLAGGGTKNHHFLRMAAETTNRPELYEQSYAKLNDWVSRSMDRHKAELTSILFPIFVHCYFGLIKYCDVDNSNQADLPHIFLTRWGHEFQIHYPNEIIALQSITMIEHLESHDYAKLLLAVDPVTKKKAMFTLHLNRISIELLYSFLQTNNLLLIFIILNDFVNIISEDRDPSTQVQIAKVGPKQEEELSEVRWGVLPLSDDMEYPQLGTSNHETKYPSFSKPYSITERLMSHCVLQAKPTYPLGAASTKDLSNMAKAETPSILFSTLMNTQGGVSCANITQDGTLLAAAFGDHSVRVWNTIYQNRNINEDDHMIELRNHSKPVYSISWSPDQRNLLTAGGDGDIRLWDIKLKQSNHCLACFKGHSLPVWCVDFCPLGHYFLSGSMDQTCRLWAIDQSQPLRIFVGHYSDVTCCLFHPNSCYALTGSCDKTARLWDMESGKCLRIFNGHESTISCLSITPCGKYLATGSEDFTCRIWDIASGKECAILKGHEGNIHSLDFSMDGTILVTGSSDTTIKLWNIQSTFHEATSKSIEHCGIIQPESTFRTKNSPVIFTRWTQRNLLLAAGVFEI